MSYIVHWSDPNTLLAVECTALGVQWINSTVQFSEAGMVAFTATKFGKGDFTVNDYGKLV